MWNPPLRRAVLIGAPLMLGILEIFHPRGADLYATVADDVGLWLGVHLVQLPLFGLAALAVYLLLEGIRGTAATIGRVAMGCFVIFYTALDAIAGIASGILVSRAQELPPEQQETVAWLVDAFTANFSAPLADGGGPAFVVTLLGGLGWVVGLVATAVALRRTGAPTGAAVLVGLSALFFVHDAPTAPVAMLCLLAGTVWIEFRSPVSSTATPTAPGGT